MEQSPTVDHQEVNTIVVSAFPGTGKTHFAKYTDLDVLDSDSSKYSWVKEGVRHPDFPANYIRHIKENLGVVNIILVSTHKVVREALTEAGIDFLTAGLGQANSSVSTFPRLVN